MKKTIFAAFALVVLAVNAQQQPSSKQRGEEVYKTHCLSCHQVNGSGVHKMNPPLVKTSYVTGDKKKLISWVLQGSTEKVPIDGEYYNNNMPAQNSLSDEQIADVLTYIRSSFGNKSSAVLPAEVKSARAALK